MASIEDVLENVSVPPDHPFFYPRVCTLVARENSAKGDIFSEEFDDLSRRLDRTDIQEATAVRNVLKARLLATKLIGEDGELNLDELPHLRDSLKKKLYSIAPGRQFDAVRDKHILQVLETLATDKDVVRMFRSITRPVSNRLAEQIIRDTLTVPSNIPITDVHVRRAVLAAWLTTLRQSLGSCFATAPAIVVHQEQPLVFLRDLDDMMNTGYMRRTYAGREHSVPMSATWGHGDLKKPITLERDLNLNENKIWMSPGILAALDSVDFFGPELKQKEKIHELHLRLQKAVDEIEFPGHIIVTNAEELIRKLLMHQYDVSESQLRDYLERPKTMMQSTQMVHMPQAFGKKANLIPLFLKNFEIAKTAFKVLADNALLKSWEFTLASFSEINLNFTRWNLYASLGINYDDPGGIGEYLYQILSTKVEQANNILKEHQLEYEQVWAQLQYLQARAQNASTEKEITWMKMEYQSRQTELYHLDKLRQMAHEKALKLSELYQFLINQYDRLFFDFFQEVYDADLHDVAAGPFDDCPAGFRLLYKHGRANPSLWTRIHSLPEFIEALVSFFTITEAELRTSSEIKGIEEDFSFILTHLIGHIRSDRFIESAFYRMAKAHNVAPIANPIQNIEKIEKKPWVYTSGGSMSTLVSAYFRREEPPTEVSRWVENETELLAFFIDTVKQLPTGLQDAYAKEIDKSMLMHSPTHAFLLKPGYFKQAWMNDVYTYSWIKHQFAEPAMRMCDEIAIEVPMAEDMIRSLYYSVPQDFRPRFKQLFQQFPYNMSPQTFRDHIIDTFHSDRGLRTHRGPVLSSDVVDSVIYSHIPYVSRNELTQTIEEVLFSIFPTSDRAERLIQTVCDRVGHNVISAKRLLEMTKAISSLILQDTRTERDLHKAIVDSLRAKNRLLPAPLKVADSNWVKDYFSFVLNPATGNLEFWSTDFYGVEGRPINYWKMWINGSRKSPEWGIFYKPFEYVAKM
ncbi:MAG: hypothetical protein JSR37_03495 [Verrucomicrobia bacterium]|nr:hypothetical protein [Verrucomicrobiota bacterium]MBS0636455.1 hypothetical protein [Verrucomicrobiota bacterium]